MNQPVNTTAPAAPAPAAAPSMPSTPMASNAPGVMTPDDIFAEFSRKIGLQEDENMDDLSQARRYEDTSAQDLYDRYNSKDKETVEEEEASQTNQMLDGETEENIMDPVETEADDKPFEYKFKGKIGNQDKEFTFKSQEHLNKALTKAFVADKVYERYQSLKSEFDQAQEHIKFSKEFDEMVGKDPTHVLEAIVEDMDEKVLEQWLLTKAEELSRDPKQRTLEKRLKHAEMLEKKFEEMERQREELSQQRVRSAQEADNHVVAAWREGVLARAQSRIPEQHHAIVKDVLQSTLLEGSQRRKNNETVSVKTLDAIFTRRMRPILELIKAREADPKTVQREVGRAIENKKQEGLSRVQQATQSLQGRTQTRRKSDGDEDISGMFDDLINQAGRGRLKMRG